MLKELISIISPLYGGTFLDCTFGQGGYSKEILKKKINKVIAIDRDKEVGLFAKEIKKKYNNRFQFYNIKFSEINTIKLKSNDLKGIIFDLGYSNNQIKDLNNIAEKLSDKYDLDGRYLIRNSGTEPLLRVLIEAKDTQSVNEFSDELINNIKNYLFT